MRVLIIGAGILGSSAAYHLAAQGIEVEIVDQAHQGKATMAGAGIVCPWATRVEEAEWYKLYEAGTRFYDGLISGLTSRGETDLGYGKVGALVVAEDRAEFDAAADRVARRTANAPEAGEVRHLNPAEARALFPPLREDLDAIHIPGAARVDARLLSAAMVRAAVSMGAKFRNDYVTLRTDGDRAGCLDSTGAEIAADQIIVTAGAWASQILRPLGLHHPVVPQKGQIVHLRLPGVATAKWPVVLPMSSHYMLAFDDSRVVIGATRENNSGFDYRVTAAGEMEVLSAGLKIAPGLAHATLIETRIGFRPAGETMNPILGRVPGFANLTLGNGLGAGGLTIGPFAGSQIARIAAGQATDIPLDLYAPKAS
ncbi:MULTISPECIES: FAD-dependent oxidoreductase [unclassified Rhizobium]|uniref:NAD(P)/FAD-dependent oxidoreductase n=1 Tax=unclassified Rhizobium TaxID=2613769 RepID=UPI001AE48E8C|nr:MULTISPECIES: FAD-dependent oxidoreductase [unclassified Rhizobium]MBP2463860.1 D-amino-acid dehydrogenase [Rhizobium sp. PvP014]MBP2532087.1 D-amino-acid dehydrogenase [Rhizobium sp. PvP099]